MSKTPEKKAMPKLYIRFAEHKDLQNILDFYETNQHSNVRKREEKILEDLAGKGSIVLIEDEKGVIVASSISYPHSIEKNGAPSCQWVEVGSTRIVANGYPGLFDVMTTAQILRAYLVEPPEQCFVGHMEHKAVQGIAKRLGWKEFDAPQALLDVSNNTVETDELTKRSQTDWFQCDILGVQKMAQYMVDIMKKPVLTHVKTKHQYEISLERSKVLRDFWGSVENLAAKDFDKPENQADKTKGIKASRDKWLYKVR